MKRRLGIQCYSITDKIHGDKSEPVKQQKKRHLPRRCALASENDSYQYLEALNDQSDTVINPIMNQQIKTGKEANERIARRRIGIYSEKNFTDVYSVSNEQDNRPPNKRHLQRRCGIVSKHNSDQYQTDDTRYGNSTIANGENEQSHVTEKNRRRYVAPSSLDVIMEGRVCDGNIGIKGYVETLYADHYREAISRSERRIIAGVVLGSIEVRGGRCLKESKRKEGMYYEVDELYAMKKVKAVLRNPNPSAKHATYITD